MVREAWGMEHHPVQLSMPITSPSCPESQNDSRDSGPDHISQQTASMETEILRSRCVCGRDPGLTSLLYFVCCWQRQEIYDFTNHTIQGISELSGGGTLQPQRFCATPRGE